MKKAQASKATKKPEVVVTRKLATPPVTNSAVNLASIAALTGAVIAADGHYAPIEAQRAGNSKAKVDVPSKSRTDRVATEEEVAQAVHMMAEDSEDRAEELMAKSEKVAKAKKHLEAVGLPNATPPSTPQHEATVAAGFKFIAERDGAYGYQHEDGRAVLLMSNGTWLLRHRDGAERKGSKLPDLKAHLTVRDTRRNMNKAAHRLEQQKRAAKRVAEVDPVPGLGGEPLPPTVKEVTTTAGVATHVVRALEILGGLTKQSFRIDDLRGDKHYSTRMSLMKKLMNTDKVLVKDCGINNVVTSFYSAIGAVGKSAAAKAAYFTQRARKITADVRKVKAAATRKEKKLKRAVLRDTLLERTVPGTILPTYTPPTKKQRQEQDDATRREVYALSVTSEQPAVPHPDADIKILPDDVRLLEDPLNGLAMMQLERANSQGAICVYNNGSRVAAGVVPAETLNKLRPIGKADLLEAARQLLNPLNVSVPVTPVAARHLTAVLHCKEMIPMTPETTTAASKKFAAPKASKKETKKAETKVSKGAAVKAAHAKAEKKERAPRASNFDYTIKVQATKAATDAKEGSFPGMLGKYAAKPVTMESLIATMAKNSTLRSAQDPVDVMRVRVRDAFNRLGLLKAAK